MTEVPDRYLPALDIDTSEWDDPDYEVLAFLGRDLLDALPQQSAMFGFPHTDAFRPQRWLKDGNTVTLGEARLEVLHCPGHTPGHVVFFQREGRLAFVGDVLFKGSIGRTALPGGDHDALIHSIRDKLWPLGEDVVFVPGHGAMSSFGWERRSNPFIGDGA